MTKTRETAKAAEEPKIKMSKWGFLLYRVWGPNGKPIWVSIPDRE